MKHSRPGRPAIPDEEKRVHYSSTMAPELYDWLRQQPGPMTKIIDGLVAEYKDKKENVDDDQLINDIKTLIKRARK